MPDSCRSTISRGCDFTVAIRGWRRSYQLRRWRCPCNDPRWTHHGADSIGHLSSARFRIAVPGYASTSSGRLPHGYRIIRCNRATAMATANTRASAVRNLGLLPMQKAAYGCPGLRMGCARIIDDGCRLVAYESPATRLFPPFCVARAMPDTADEPRLDFTSRRKRSFEHDVSAVLGVLPSCWHEWCSTLQGRGGYDCSGGERGCHDAEMRSADWQHIDRSLNARMHGGPG